jgi:hypothetical protein
MMSTTSSQIVEVRTILAIQELSEAKQAQEAAQKVRDSHGGQFGLCGINLRHQWQHG